MMKVLFAARVEADVLRAWRTRVRAEGLTATAALWGMMQAFLADPEGAHLSWRVVSAADQHRAERASMGDADERSSARGRRRPLDGGVDVIEHPGAVPVRGPYGPRVSDRGAGVSRRRRGSASGDAPGPRGDAESRGVGVAPAEPAEVDVPRGTPSAKGLSNLHGLPDWEDTLNTVPYMGQAREPRVDPLAVDPVMQFIQQPAEPSLTEKVQAVADLTEDADAGLTPDPEEF